MNKIWSVYIGLIITTVPSCNVLFDKNIEEVPMILLAPPDQLTTSMTQFTFWWEELDDANEYNLQIVSPSFDFIQELLLDTLIENNKWELHLPPGEYQWRVRGVNAKNETNYFTRTLMIIISDSLDNQQVVLSHPSNNFISNNPLITFRWFPIETADEYLFELRDPLDNFLINPKVLTTDSLQLTVPEGRLVWRVQARNEFSQTAFSSRSLTLDMTAPGIPVLVSPMEGDSILGGSVILQWNRIADSGTELADSLYIYNGSLSNKIEQLKINATSFHAIFNPGTFLWHIRTIDEAGNKSTFSETRSFVVE